MSTIAHLTTSHHAIPLGAGRGGSGATRVDLVIVTVEDSDGGTGTGFTFGLTGGAGAARHLLENDLRAAVTGTRLDHWPATWEALWNVTHRLGRGHALPAVSALDIAVHDLLAVERGLPLYRYLGAHADSVPIYGSGRATHAMSDAELVEGAERYAADGIHAVKLRAGVLGLERDVARVARVRSALGDATRIMVDCNERLGLADAIWLARRLADLGVYWIEEPLRSDDVEGHRQLAARGGLPVAVGEHLLGRFEFAQYLQRRAASVLQPDPPLCGGVTEWRRIAAIAEAGSAVLSPHFLPELNVHLALSAPNCSYIEHFPLLDGVLLETIEISDGRARPPDRPGHGLRFDPDALRAHRV
ncbi:L-alanine-DL-glutamate epimerase [Actinomadura meyerae]|uniref:L-alanine-DL-glutamate epimerase n=1 Tax=Actinomadura meyerae TaxID=240840 RepID=A0A239NF92_9ACTN|nr:mandelate racemase/muconate lactonizing enzyme family protein [Actinomadura meyerae]SNT53535.1 L-alanine-DL-glutamate epimerase [Actinomadura meyerae]